MRFLLQKKRFLFSLFLILACMASIAWYAWQENRHFRNLQTVRQGVLYRSGQLTRKGLQRVIYEKNIGTVINLRSDDKSRNTDSNAWEEELCAKNFTCFISLPIASHDRNGAASPLLADKVIENAAEKFLAIMSDPVTYPRPVLIHCLGGVHRTGVMVALYRMECQGWSRERAIAEMREHGYHDFSSHDPLRDYVLTWKPRNQKNESSTLTRHQ